MSSVLTRKPCGLFRVVCVRWSSALSGVQSQKVGENLELRLVNGGSSSSQATNRPLVLLFSWLMAKKRHLDKYGNLYLSEGFDVLNIQVKPGQVLYPPKAQNIVGKVLDVLGTEPVRHKPIFVHGFSVGGYVYGEFLVKLLGQPEKYGHIGKRMVGQVFDSPVDFEGVPRGFANVLASNALAKSVIKSSIEAYLSAFKNSVTHHYKEASRAFHENALRLPSLMLYSRADPIGVADIIEMVAQKWRDQGLPVRMKCWENSPHVSHFHRHPDEYVEALLSFLEQVGLQKPEAQAEKEVLLSKKNIMENKP